MTDPVDRAQQLEQEQRDRALARAKQHDVTTGSIYCEECGEPIPKARREAQPNAVRCIECQQFKELYL